MSAPTILDRLVDARAALLELAPLVHADRPEHVDCGTWGKCEAYHDALRSLTGAAETLGFSVASFARLSVDRVADRIEERSPW